jgi:hypothetical protein
LITAASLKSYTHKDLAQMAKERSIAGWHGMRKAQLVEVLLAAHKTKPGSTRPSVAEGTRPAAKVAKIKKRPTAVQRRIQAAQAQHDMLKDLATDEQDSQSTARRGRDQLLLMVRDPYWLQATWEITGGAIERARAALAEFWHTARPVLRVIEIPATAKVEAAETVLRVIEVHGAVNNWYVDVQDPPCSYRAELGYLSTTGKFYTLARSNVVSTPRPGSKEIMDRSEGDVVENSERIFAMSGGYSGNGTQGELREYLEERLHRPLGAPTASQFGSGAEGILGHKRSLEFSVDAEMIVYGRTLSDAFVTMNGEPVTLSADGSFVVRVSLPDRRQVIPMVASTRDGAQEQTIVLAVERNTKIMEPKVRETV